MSVADDERRSRRLLFSRELAAGTVRDADLVRREVREAVASRHVPSRVTRAYQRVLMGRGSLGYLDHDVAAVAAARSAVLGAAAPGPPRLLVRVDEFPHAGAWMSAGPRGTEAFRRFHDLLTGAGMAYLVAVPARVSRDPLDPSATESRPLDDGEVAMLAQLRRDGVAFALHGLDHRTRHASSRRHGELTGLSAAALDERLARAEAELAERAAIRPEVLVPPFNRFDWRRWDVLARRYAVVAGGPESVARMGYHRTPLWRGDAVWLPSYPPLYGRAGEVLAGVRELARRDAAVWAPVVLHWGWEADDGWAGLVALVAEAARFAVPWDEFLEAVRLSRGV